MNKQSKSKKPLQQAHVMSRADAQKLWKHWGLLKNGQKVEHWRCSNCGGGYKSCEDKGTSASFGCKRKVRHGAYNI